MSTNNKDNDFALKEGQFWVHQYYRKSQEQKSIFVSYIDQEKGLLIMKKYEKGVPGVVSETSMKISTAIKLINSPHEKYSNMNKFYYKTVDYPAFEADDKYIIAFYDKLKNIESI